MGEVHQLILREGLESARSRADTRAERQVVEAAGMTLAERCPGSASHMPASP